MTHIYDPTIGGMRLAKNESKVFQAVGDNSYRDAVVPELTEEEKVAATLERIEKQKQNSEKAEERRIQSVHDNADTIMDLIEVQVTSGNMLHYLEETSSDELNILLNPFREYVPTDTSQSTSHQEKLIFLTGIYNESILSNALYNLHPESVPYRQNWRRFLENVEQYTSPKAEKHKNISARKKRAKRNSKITFRSIRNATAQSIAIGLAIVFGGKTLIDNNGGSLLSRSQCVTSDIGVNIRAEPSSWQKEKTVIARLPFQSVVTTKGSKINKDWYKATAEHDGKNITGYVHSSYIGSCTP